MKYTTRKLIQTETRKEKKERYKFFSSLLATNLFLKNRLKLLKIASLPASLPFIGKELHYLYLFYYYLIHILHIEMCDGQEAWWPLDQHQHAFVLLFFIIYLFIITSFQLCFSNSSLFPLSISIPSLFLKNIYKIKINKLWINLT